MPGVAVLGVRVPSISPPGALLQLSLLRVGLRHSGGLRHPAEDAG